MRERLDAPLSPAGRKCFVCGSDNPKGLKLKFYRLDHDAVTAELVPPPEWCGWDSLMHGGLQCLLLDEVTGWALVGLRGRYQCMTLSLEVKYRKPVRLDQKLTLIGRIVKETNTGSRVLGQILNQDGLVLCEAMAKIAHLNEERFSRIIESAP